MVTPGFISAKDPIEVIHRPAHDITVAMAFRATTTERDLLPRLLEAGDDLDPELRQSALNRSMITLDPDPGRLVTDRTPRLTEPGLALEARHIHCLVEICAGPGVLGGELIMAETIMQQREAGVDRAEQADAGAGDGHPPGVRLEGRGQRLDGRGVGDR